MIRFLTLAGIAVGLAGCSIIPDPSPPNVVYRLSLTGSAVQAQEDAVVIRVDRPSASSVFDTKSIVVSPDGRRLSTVALAEWSESAPTLIQASLIDAFSREASIIGVLPQSGTRTDIRIHLTVKNFEAQFDRGEGSAPLAVVRYSVSLANATDRKLIATYDAHQTQRADAPRVSAIVAALETANDAAMKNIVEWVVSIDQKEMF
jgi:cholesterol transport system auxiliary component